ncbi:MAG: SCP2 sterol-binding domain-containing protein [Bacteroidia bacterium]|nr:SCP2 sterol-binding domain-containing protein [Bacteroidia bacterium]
MEDVSSQNGSNGINELVVNIQASAVKASPLGSTLKFDFGAEKLLIDGTGETNTVSTDDRDAACTVEVSMADFKSLIKGQLNPMSAMMSGKLKINGDMGVAMKLQSLFA